MNHQNSHADNLTPILLQTKNLTHNFDYPLFHNINLTLRQGKTIAIIGVSGSGKSTLLNILSSLLKPNSGEVLYNEKSLYSLNKEQLLSVRRKDFGIIFQAHYLFRGFDALENLMIAEHLSGIEIDHELLRTLKIDHVIHQAVGELSGGQQQRLSIARILSKKPKVIFADEPTGNLDQTTAHEVMYTMFNFVKENQSSMILVTHEEELAQTCDEVYKLENMELIKLK